MASRARLDGMSHVDSKDDLRTELTASMKARDALRSSTLRMVLTAITNAEVSGKQARELTDDDVIGVLATEAKKRREAADGLRGGRPPGARRQGAGRGRHHRRVPARAAVRATRSRAGDRDIADLGVAGEGMRAMGKVMGALTPETKGRADGGAVSAEVRRQLGA